MLPMTSTPPPLGPSPLRSSATSSRKGCVIGCLAAVIGVPLLLLLCGYLLIMHSSVPLKMLAGAASQADGLTIKGISGSIASGFSIEELRTEDSNGKESVMEGLTLKWDDMTRLKTSRELIIEEIGLERAHIYFDSDDMGKGESESNRSEGTDSGASNSPTDNDGTELELLEIRKVDIREVVFESTTDGFQLELDEILMEGLRIQGDEFELGALTVGSNFLDLELEDAQPTTIAGQEIPFTRRLVGSVKPNVHESLAREIDFTFDMGAIDGAFVHRIQMLDGKVRILDLGDDGQQQLRIEDLDPPDYISPDWHGLVRDLSLMVTNEKRNPQTGLRKLIAESGTFSVGSTEFVIDSQILLEEGPEAEESDSAPAPTIVATANKGDLTITARLHHLDGPPFFGVSLNSTPEHEPQDLLSLLLFDQSFADLNPARKAEVKTAVEKHLRAPTESR